MGRSNSGASDEDVRRPSAAGGGVDAAPLVDRLAAAALLLALRPSGGLEVSADRLARLARGRTEALDRARARILRRESGRPTRITADAAAALRLARALTTRAPHRDGGGQRRGDAAGRDDRR